MNKIKYLMSLVACSAMLFSCEKQTTPDPVRVQFPDNQSEVLRDDAYFARLRAFKKTDHKLSFGWYGSWTGIGASEQSHMRSVPDSMDIISLWSQWHSLNDAQIADKAYVQQVLGTKVVICISAKDIPEEFKEEGGEYQGITDAALAAYAKAWAKDSMDKYQYDGIDIDFETASDHLGPLNNQKGRFKKFCEILSQYIGPKSGTGRLFLIDGNLESLDLGMADLFDYGVCQAYATGGQHGDDKIDYRFKYMEAKGFKIENMIFTENFESYWKTGGIPYDTYEGEVIESSLLGMAHYALNHGSAGCGAYHMEYEYGNAEMPYKYMRQAIQMMNPAPKGDYTKNLMTLNEAGAFSYDAFYFPSGKNVLGINTFTKEFTAKLSAVAEDAVNIPLVVDNSLVEQYNLDNYSEYQPLPTDFVSFSDLFIFEKGNQEATNKVSVIVDNLDRLQDGAYIVPVRADFTTLDSYSANEKKAVIYIQINRQTIHNNVSFTNGGSTIKLEVKFDEKNIVFEDVAYELSAQLDYKALENATIQYAADPQYGEMYNKEHGTAYEVLTPNMVDTGAGFTFKTGSDHAYSICTIKAGTPIQDKTYIMALRFEIGETQQDYAVSEKQGVVYFLLKPKFFSAENNVSPGATSIDGNPIVDMSGWSATYKGAAEGELINGNLEDWISDWSDAPAVVEIKMSQDYTLAGFRLTPIGGAGDFAIGALKNIQTSTDGIEWKNQSAEDEDIQIGAVTQKWQHMQFIKPVTCRYLRFTISKSNSGVIGCGEFQAIEVK